MSDKMFPVKIASLLRWMGEESSVQQSVFQVPLELLNSPPPINCSTTLFGKYCSVPIGPAAGPHTQMAQNIIAAYAAGGRFFELKTVQKMDALEFPKPCIDAKDEGYNTEWSTELTLEEAFSEYAKAWIILHLMHLLFNPGTEADFIFNMSVGYNLDGIRSERMEEFINGLINSESNPAWNELITQTKRFFNDNNETKSGIWKKGGFEPNEFDRLIPKRISNSVTLSTMHGCPPREIEAIAEYLLREKRLHTYIKLNPTLLGFDIVSQLLIQNGFKDIELDPMSFSSDLSFVDAIPMIKRLQKISADEDLEFGIKLSNTLGVKNTDHSLPGNEKYMSGRSLFPLTIRLAEEISSTLLGNIRISFSGGADSNNISKILESGIYPVTVVTDLLKPGGYGRLSDMVISTLKSGISLPEELDIPLIKALSASGIEFEKYKKKTKMPLRALPVTTLPLFDCFEAPCVTACPIHQDIPQYIQLAGTGNYEESLELIYDKNPLPNITGYICDHQCEFHCTRNDYENPVGIREVKRIAAQYGKRWKEKYVVKYEQRELPAVAIVGGGPAGLSAAYFLIREGFPVTVFEKNNDPGGVINQFLPEFRIPTAALAQDIAFIESLGAVFHFEVKIEETKIEALKKAGFEYIFYAIGAGVGKHLQYDKNDISHIEALDFLRMYREDPAKIKAGKNVVVIGGGNTAMDSSRVAKRIHGVANVKLIYRRSLHELPADREEFEMALQDGVEFMPLVSPVKVNATKHLVLEKMKLGQSDDGGRALPVGTGEFFELDADLVITAIGEEVDKDMLRSAGIPFGNDGWPILKVNSNETVIPQVFLGGDARSGPATVVEAIADARKFADAIMRKHNLIHDPISFKNSCRPELDEIFSRRGKRMTSLESSDDKVLAERESSRCLHCDLVCNKCVEVCPNRANMPINSLKRMKDIYQVIHIDDLCNECGNCATFCPKEGRPYQDKLTIFGSENRFADSANSGFYIKKNGSTRKGKIRIGNEIYTFNFEDSDITEIIIENGSGGNQLVLKDMKRMVVHIIENYNYLLL